MQQAVFANALDISFDKFYMHPILAALIILAATPAMAEWKEVSKVDGNTTYVDPQSIQKDGTTLKARVLIDLLSPIKNTSIMSFRNQIEYDCQVGRSKPIEMIGFSGQMATGSVLHTSTPPYEWSNVVSGRPSETVLKYVCSQAGIAVATIAAANTPTNELFIGRFASETRENFGADEFGKYAIEIERKGDGFTLNYFKDNQPFFALDVHKCSEESLKTRYYHTFALPGEVQALCGNHESVQFFYAQNGIKIPEQAPVKEAAYKTQYYANVQWAVYGFKKIK